MADIINLNKKRKAKQRLEKEKQASENRIKFGRTKKEKLLAKQENERNQRHLDGHQLEKDIKIAYLKEYPEVIPTLAKIWHEVLGSIWIADVGIEQIEQGFYDELNDSTLPLTFIALKGSQVIGAISLHKHDEIKPDLTPWLESLVVDKTYQNQGVGKMLIEKIRQKARDLDFKKLYLFAFTPALVNYYAQFGFKLMGIDRFKEQEVSLMELML
ncbi:MAG: GNAT family N-acetyltransferase [Legionella sp.]|nr:MAG: GNAT family N-acetyltransferase [Legionella sp.]